MHFPGQHGHCEPGANFTLPLAVCARRILFGNALPARSFYSPSAHLKRKDTYQQPYRIVKTYETVEPVAGKLTGEAILRDFPGKGSVDAIFTVNDGGRLGVVDILAQAGRMEIQVASIDGDPQSVEKIRKHRRACACFPKWGRCYLCLPYTKTPPHQHG